MSVIVVNSFAHETGAYPSIFNSAVQLIDPSDLSTVNGISIGDPLRQIDCINGSGNNYVQHTSGDRPILRAGYIESVSNDYMRCGMGISKLAARTAFVVFKLSSLSGSQFVIGDGQVSGASSSRSLTVASRTSINYEGAYGDGTNLRKTESGTPTTLLTSYNTRFPADSGNLEEIEIDGVAQAEVDGGGTATTIGGPKYDVAIFRPGHRNATYMTGEIHFISVWDSRLSDADNAIVTGYIADRFPLGT